MPLAEDTKNQIVGKLLDQMLSAMFGDGLETDYIMDGMNFKGLNNMTDEELLETMEQIGLDADEELLYNKAKKEME